MRRLSQLPLLGAATTLLVVPVLAGSGRTPDPSPWAIRGQRVEATKRAVVVFADLASAEPKSPAERFRQRQREAEIHPPLAIPHDLPVPDGAGSGPAPTLEAPPVEPGPLSPAPAATFEALLDNFTRVPPDTHGAVGPSHLVVALNSEVRIQNRSGVTLSLVTLENFWSAVAAGGDIVFDPKVAYDPFNNRWMMTACDDAFLATSALLIGVSRTGDPTGAWDLYRVDGDGADVAFVDYPSLGFNKDWIAVQVNMFNISNGAFNRTHIYAFAKAGLYAGTPSVTLIPVSGIGGTQVPAVTHDNAISSLYLLQNWNGGAGALRLYQITGAVGSETLSPVGFPQSAATPWDSVPGPPGNQDFAPQLGTSARIQNNDARIQNVVYRNGRLWTTHTVFLPSGGTATRAAVQWWQITPTAAVLQRGRLDDSSGNVFYAFPSVAVNVNDDALIGYSRFAASQFASSNYSFRTGNDPPNTLQADLLFKAGEAPYFKPGNGQNRWGDYSNTVVDPVNDRDLWTIQEYAETPVGPDRWGTWWARVATTPTLSIGDVLVSEGNSGGVVATFTVTLSRPVLQTVQVSFTTTNGTATTGDNDYLAASGSLTFIPGQTSQPVNVTVQGDVKFEPNETFTVDLSSPVNANLLDGQGVGTIQNDDPIPQISVNDVAVPEGNSGISPAVFTVTLSNPSSQTVDVSYSTPGITASAPLDYTAIASMLTFVPGDVSETVTVNVNGDTTVEPDETYQVFLSGPVNAGIADNTGLGTILNDDVPGDGVAFFTVTSKPGQNWLEWVNPSAGPFFGALFRYNVSTPGTSNCTHPTAATGAGSGMGGIGPLIGPGLGGRDSAPHGALPPDTRVCYTAFVQKDAGGTLFSGGIFNQGRPFTAGPVKWALSMGGIFSMIPPGNGVGVVHAVAQDGSLHAMVKGAVPEGGTWPTTPLFPFAWMPQRMSGPSQGRPSGVATSTGLSTRTIFLSSQDGHVYAFNAETGGLAWISPLLAPATALQAHPSGVFTVFGGTRDYVFVGTREAAGSRIYALNTADGTQAWVFDGVAGGFGRVGAVNGQAAVDQVTRRVYFASRAFGASPDNNTVWCVDLETGLGLWAEPHGDIDTAVTFSNGRLLVGTNPPNPTVKAIDTVTPNEGVPIWSFAITPPAEGPAKGYVGVDRISGSVFFSTATRAWALNSNMTPMWLPNGDRSLSNASTPVFAPQDAYVYFGGGDGRLHRLFVAGGTEDMAPPFPIPLGDGAAAAGSPTYDLPAGYMYVGTENGIIYAVQLP
jgi:outer membrane protein assembly factor BamB